jgi:hypothetical protein
MKVKIQLIRIGYRQTVVEVEADDLRSAKQRALAAAVDVEFPEEHDAEFAASIILEEAA